MSDTTKRYILSSVVTFVSAFLTTLGIMLSSGMPIEWTGAFIFGLLIAGVRAGAKAVVESLIRPL